MERAPGKESNPINLKEASRRLNVSYMTVHRWIKQGKLTPVRILGLPYLSVDQVESLKAERDNQAARGNQAA